MLDPKNRAEAEQSIEFLGEVLPVLWHKLFKNCVEQGFTEEQAILCLLTYIKASNNYVNTD